jgi:hypothetical protein
MEPRSLQIGAGESLDASRGSTKGEERWSCLGLEHDFKGWALPKFKPELRRFKKLRRLFHEVAQSCPMFHF